MPEDSLLRAELRSAGHDGDITSVRKLDGGFAAGAWLVCFADGTRVVGKTLADAPDGLFAAEAEGLAALRATGHVRVPDILAVTRRLLLLGELPAREDSEPAWEALALGLAAMHRDTVSARFGWASDGYLGLFRQENTWTVNGHEFFTERRLLRYLREPRVGRALTAADRRALEACATACRTSSRRCPPSSRTATCGP
ncbi:MAG: fructosamine kinase family protein [Trebonia sp.]